MPTTHSDSKILSETDSSLYEYEEAEVASGKTIYPGMVVEKTGENSDYEETPTVQPVATADKLGENFMIALTPRAPPRGSDSDKPIEHEYDAGESVQIAICQPGCDVQNAILAAGNNLTGGGSADLSYDDPIVTNDDGGVKSQSTAGAIFARAREAVDNSGAGSDQGGISGARLNLEVV